MIVCKNSWFSLSSLLEDSTRLGPPTDSLCTSFESVKNTSSPNYIGRTDRILLWLAQVIGIGVIQSTHISIILNIYILLLIIVEPLNWLRDSPSTQHYITLQIPSRTLCKLPSINFTITMFSRVLEITYNDSFTPTFHSSILATISSRASSTK